MKTTTTTIDETDPRTMKGTMTSVDFPPGETDYLEVKVNGKRVAVLNVKALSTSL